MRMFTPSDFKGVFYAHRGLYNNQGGVPENSLPAFHAAAEKGYGVELDVQLSLDGQVVVFHDDTLDRVTGVHGNVVDFSRSQLQQMRLLGTEETIPLFTDVLAELRRAPECGPVQPWKTGGAAQLDEGVLVNHNWDDIRRLMWDYVGIVRSNKRLALMRERLDPLLREIRSHFDDYLLTPDLVELRNIATTAELIIDSAMLRHESRGLHYNADYPERNPELDGVDTVIRISMPDQ